MAGKPLFQQHHGVDQKSFEKHALLQVLVDNGRLDKDATTNLINLPNDKALARAIGVTPHTGRHIKEYPLGIRDALNELAATKDGQAVLLPKPDPNALDRVALKVQRLGDTVQIALINGDLRTNNALGETIAQTRAITRAFYLDPDGYASQNSIQLDAHAQLSPNSRQWAPVTYSEGRIVSTLQHFQSSGRPLLRDGNLDFQRNSLSQAIADAYHDGRLTISPGGVAVVENTLGEEAANSLRVPRGQRGEVSMQLLMGEASARGLIRAGGLLATGADAVMTARTAATLMEQGNLTAAQSEVNHAVARNVGGWAGGASTAAALGSSSSFVPAALVVGDAVLMSKAFDKAVDLKENRDIFHQTDKAGVDWQFNGRNWERQGQLQEGQGKAVEQDVVASYAKSLELGAMANAKAVEFALGKAPRPQDPFDLPAQPGDRIGLDNQNWHRNPDTEKWERQVKTGVDGANDRGVYEPQFASAEQTQRLNQEALARIEGNIATGREAIAQAYLESHAAQRGQDYGVGVPAAAENAKAKTDRVQAHTGEVYERNEAGQWVGKDGAATGNLAMELELTNLMRQPSLERAQETLAAIEARPAPTAAQMEHNELLHRYRAVGIDLNAQENNLEAVKLATQRTREAEGLTGRMVQRLKPNEQGQYGYDSQIVHYQVGQDGLARQVAVTTSDELRQAKAELSQAAVAHVPTLATVSVTAPGRGKEQEAEQTQEKAMPGQVLADNPAHPDHSTYQTIHSWVSGTGNWNEEESRNVTAALYRQQIEDPLVKRVDRVTGALGKDGAENVLAVYAPFGDKLPFFHARVDGREAAQQPAEQNLQQAEVIKQDQVHQQALEQTQQQIQRQEQGPRMTL
ncbi:XVIPCD domain-containing protein [Xanthomonas sp. SHU 199]|uniref:XVIPCD domain-containing protein n=1 Tax=Xanthomonas sp. SHU 199 TaxID=1591174 RepID=UPI00039A76E8|nr:XVIPCD domain-containing protein [Xanthomonas sp. SHU 199]